MKHSLLRIFLAASLAFMPFSPGMAAVNVMSDEDLGAVSARGFDGEGALPQSSYSAIQAFGAAQWYASALSIENTIDAGINLSQNVSVLKDVGDIWLFSTSYQYAYNGVSGNLLVINDEAVQGQNNNLGSIQFNDNALYGASALSIVNAAASARNMYQKFRTIENADDVTVVRFSYQTADKRGDFTQTVTNGEGATDQTNNNASIQIGGRAQASISSAALTNLAASSQNVSQMWTGIKNSEDVFLLQSSTQDAYNDVASEQAVYNLTTIFPGAAVYRNQHNNNGSVQLGGEEQSFVESFLVSNAAVSAVNIGQNMVYAETVKGLSAIQTNEQYAENYNDIAQAVWNYGSMEGQNNNSTSVQAFGCAQASSQPGLLVNAAGSAVNEGLNIVSAALIGGECCHRHGHEIFFTQNNDQDASGILGGDGQAVVNFRRAAQQSNNFGAVQMNENAQNWTSAVAVTNAASSAVNVGQNFVFLAGGEYVMSIEQLNDQAANNSVSGVQGVWNWDGVEDQNNNHASVQIGGGAQSCVDVVSLANVAGSAVNIGQNLASITGGKEVRVHQANCQSAVSETDTVQGVYNWAVQNQNNNNGSVQLAAAQNRTTSNSIVNAAISAVNVGQNIAQASVCKEAFVEQFNDQYTDVSWGGDQYVTSGDGMERQYNNNAAVQLTDAQNEAKGLSILNAAASAVNVGQNVAAVEAMDARVRQTNDNQTAVVNVNPDDPRIDNERGAEDQYNNSSSVYGTGSGSQKQVQVVSLANIATSAANIGQNIADVKADKWASVKQKNDQFAEIVAEGTPVSQTVYNDWWVNNQNNNNASVQGDDLQNSMTAASIMNAALSAVNLGQNIAKVDAGEWMEVRQINKQEASVDVSSNQTIDNDTLSVAGQNNNNASVQLIGSQGAVKAISVANLAATAANVGQNVAVLQSGKEIDDGRQVNVQEAYVSSGTNQSVESDGFVSGQNNNSASIQLNGSQIDAVGVSILNAAVSAVNVGQNIAKANACKEAELKQVNVQTADDPGSSSGNTSNFASVQHADSQNNTSGLSLLDAAVSAANVGQNVMAVNAEFTDNRQVNEQEALIEPFVGSGGGLIKVTDSETGMKALSSTNVAVSAVNVGQNIAKVEGAKVADLDQVNEQYAFYGPPGSEAPSSVAAIQLANSQNDVEALSLLNAGFSAVNVGQNIAKVDAALFAHVDQVNSQSAGLDLVITPVEDDNTSSTTWSIGLSGSQNNISALSVVNAAASAVNVGQNIVKVDPWKDVHVDQVNDQTAIIVSADETSNYGLIDLADSQNNASALSIVNAAASAVNVGMNIAVVEAKYADINQVNIQSATVEPVDGQTDAGASSSSIIRLVDSQTNMSAFAIVNAAGSAVNVGRNIAVMNGVRGASLTQMNFQTAYR